jgi:hypothetical protein
MCIKQISVPNCFFASRTEMLLLSYLAFALSNLALLQLLLLLLLSIEPAIGNDPRNKMAATIISHSSNAVAVNDGIVVYRIL